MKKQKTEIIYDIDDLNYLKKLFYEFEKIEQVNSEKLNKSLNLFFGLNSENNSQWRKQFKDAIKKVKSISKAGKKQYEDITTLEFENIESKEILIAAFKKKKEIKNKLDCLYETTEFNSTIIYEAPPYLLLLKDQEGTAKTEFVAEFILDKECSSPYSNAIRGCFDDQISSITEILKNNKCGFFDVIPMPLPINSDLRNKWATEEKFVIDGKRIFVHFFEWAIANYKKSQARISDKQKHKIAIGIPLNNAITLYEKYAPQEIVEFGNHDNQNISFNEQHSIEFKDKNIGLWIHLFKNCIISTSNTPNAELMKLAFNKYTRS
jgi:hypothetical protein